MVPSNSGLSPRTRGSHRRRRERETQGGSIPAHAGEPHRSKTGNLSAVVYPRARGGAMPWSLYVAAIAGLSPRTRGSHLRDLIQREVQGSIPAHAGEPLQCVAD